MSFNCFNSFSFSLLSTLSVPIGHYDTPLKPLSLDVDTHLPFTFFFDWNIKRVETGESKQENNTHGRYMRQFYDISQTFRSQRGESSESE